jgi:hypothetical protein
MTTLSVLDLILGVTIIALARISVAAVPSLLVQLASATTTDVITEGGVGEEALDTTSMSTNNLSNSNAVLGSAFLTGEDGLTSFN